MTPGGSAGWPRICSSCTRAAICCANSAVWIPWNSPSNQPTSWACAIRSSASDGELRVAKAQLVGWLEGLFHGIQATLFAQQIAARQQLEGMRSLPPGAMAGGPGGGQLPPSGAIDVADRPGTYL